MSDMFVFKLLSIPGLHCILFCFSSSANWINVGVSAPVRRNNLKALTSALTSRGWFNPFFSPLARQPRFNYFIPSASYTDQDAEIFPAPLFLFENLSVEERAARA